MVWQRVLPHCDCPHAFHCTVLSFSKFSLLCRTVLSSQVKFCLHFSSQDSLVIKHLHPSSLKDETISNLYIKDDRSSSSASEKVILSRNLTKSEQFSESWRWGLATQRPQSRWIIVSGREGKGITITLFSRQFCQAQRSLNKSAPALSPHWALDN